MRVSTEELIRLQSHVERIRNICILAHVDHGKTTLSDHLIGSNGLIHPKLMGEMRYMDSRDDEQARGITMKSSSIALLYVPGAAHLPGGPDACSEADRRDKGILVNLIDSPGHVDFCSEVSSAARLSDGALVIIDCVEGVCIQTHAVLRQAWEEKIKLTLVLNKIDRMVLELQLSPEQAYERMRAIITQVNMILSAFQSERFISEADAVLQSQEASAQAAAREADGTEGEEPEDEDLEFSPEKGNVVFASAGDGWAFSTAHFAAMYAGKMGLKQERLGAILWGDWAYDPKSKWAVKLKKGSKLKPLFVQLVLTPLWKAYEAATAGAEAPALLAKIVKGLGLTQVPDKLLSHPEPRKALRQVLQAWLPLAEGVLGMVASHLPDPAAAAPERVKRLLPQQLLAPQGLPPPVQQGLAAMRAAVQSCSAAPEAPTVVYISKMVAVPAGALPRRVGDPPAGGAGEEIFLGVGRVFAGRVTDGQPVHVLSAAFDPARPEAAQQQATVRGLYLMMGRGLERLQSVQAGNVVAIGGLETAVLKCATLSSSLAAVPLAPMMFQASPIVRVAVEPANPTHMPQLAAGLRLLNQADPFVEVAVQESGEHVIGAAGEVHLEMCIKDLRERFARVELHVSAPLVAFRESVFHAPEAPDAVAKPPRIVEGRTANGRCILRVRATALPQPLAAALDESEALLRRLLAARRQQAGEQAQEAGEQPAGAARSEERTAAEQEESGSRESGDSDGAAAAFRSRLAEAVGAAEPPLQAQLRRAWLLGPRDAGPNLLLASEASGQARLFAAPAGAIHRLGKQRAGAGAAGEVGAAAGEPVPEEAAEQGPIRDIALGNSALARLLSFAPAADSSGKGAEPAAEPAAELAAEPAAEPAADSSDASLHYLQASVESGVAAGFQIATAAGPLCDEPMWGVAFEVEARLLLDAGGSGGGLAEEVYGPMSGQVTSVARQAFRAALLQADPRLTEAMFLCEVSTTADALAGTYAVLGQRRARVLREELREGSDLFSIHAYLPAQASFGFADDMRRRSSGAAAASLLLSHWERLQVDPFFVPTTEEEREEFGEEGQGVGAPNLAAALIEQVRRRKGLPLDRKVVESSTKQRTRARKV